MCIVYYFFQTVHGIVKTSGRDRDSDWLITNLGTVIDKNGRFEDHKWFCSTKYSLCTVITVIITNTIKRLL